MRVCRLVSTNGHITIIGGLETLLLASRRKLVMGTPPDRDVIMSYFDPEFMPLVLGNREKKADYLLSASIVEPEPGMVLVTNEFDRYMHVLLFVDTFDEQHPDFPGVFTLPPSHHPGLPAGTHSEHGVKAQYGLTIVRPGESFLVRSTTGNPRRISLSESSVFSAHACSREDLLLLGEPQEERAPCRNTATRSRGHA